MLKIGLSECGKGFSYELFSSYRNCGITEMELSEKYKVYAELNYAEVAKRARECCVNLWSFHLPFDPDIDISNPLCAERTVNIHEDIIEKATAIGIKLFVLHPSAEPIEDADRAARMALSKKNLTRLADFAEKHGAVIAVENLPRTCLGKNAAEMLELLSADERLRACFDTNHLLCGDPVEFIKTLGEKIVTVHVSDYDFINERHWLPGEGKLDWQKILAALLEVGYKGPWLYEINFEAPKTITRERNLTCEDFARNAHELFSGKPLTVIGTPKPDLGM